MQSIEEMLATSRQQAEQLLSLPTERRLQMSRTAETMLHTLQNEMARFNNTRDRRLILKDFLETVPSAVIQHCALCSANPNYAFTWICIMEMKVTGRPSKEVVRNTHRHAKKDKTNPLGTARFLLPNC